MAAPSSSRDLILVGAQPPQPECAPQRTHGSSLIASLIQLRPNPFGLHQPRQAAEATDRHDPCRTRTHRLGKRVEVIPQEFESLIRRHLTR